MRSARRSRPAGPTATPSPGSAPSTSGSSRSTPRSGTRPTPSASRRSTRTASSRCSSPSSRWSPPRSGCRSRGWKPFASSFGAFLSRAYDFVRMAAISDADLKLCGSHVGVSIGPDGPSQMALEDIASLARRPRQRRALPLRRQPDGAARRRDARAPRHQLSAHDPRRDAGALRAGRDLRDRRQPHAPLQRRRRRHLIGAGITLHECLAAADELAGRGIAARVIDLYSVKPVDADTLLRAASETRALVTVEDHWAEGGIGETVAAVLADAGVSTRLVRLAVSGRPGSGPPESLLAAAGIDAAHIVSAAERALETDPLRQSLASANNSLRLPPTFSGRGLARLAVRRSHPVAAEGPPAWPERRKRQKRDDEPRRPRRRRAADHRAARRDQGLPGRPHGARPCLAGDRPRRVRLPGRPDRLRQVDPDQDADPRAGRRPRAASASPAATSAPCRRRRSRSCGATSAPSSRTSSCSPTAPSTTTSPTRCR